MNTYTKSILEEWKPSEQDLKDIAAADLMMKRDLGSYDIEEMISCETEKFDRRKFPKLCCPFCQHNFNPFYHKTLVQKEWSWNWVGYDYKQPEGECEILCPKCNEQLYFTQFIGQ